MQEPFQKSLSHGKYQPNLADGKITNAFYFRLKI